VTRPSAAYCAGYLAAPTDHKRLSRVYRDIWWPHHLATNVPCAISGWGFSSGAQREAFPMARPGERRRRGALSIDTPEISEVLSDDLRAFRLVIMRWLQATICPLISLS